jgi:1-acyl-sn-glycerol-3-phosphate acyltransferase
MAKSELFNPATGPFVKALGAFPVRRGQADREAIQRGVELVRAGEIVVMFPEGTRREKGVVKKHKPRVHSGAARIALEAEAPLVPAGITGTDRISRFGRIQVAFGPPVELDDLQGLELREASRLATERLMDAIRELKRSLA